jgi:DinB superfamily
MKALRTLSLLTIALRLSAAGMSTEDRQHLMVHLQMTEQWLGDEVSRLSPSQLNFRSAPDRWSVRECVAHLAVAEPDYWRDFMKAVKSAPSQAKSSATDADILWYGIDRVVHTKTGGGHEKVERYPELAPALADFKKLRATMLEYVRSTGDDLRGHSFGKQEPIDCWQWMLEISTHAQRHILQIREIKADANFPRQ